MEIYAMRKQLGITQKEFAERYNIPFRTIQNWETGSRKPPEYIVQLLNSRVKEDLVNRKTYILPEYDPNKIDLPKRSDFVGAISWLKAVKESVGDDVVFALDEALMCQEIFGGHSEEYLVWVYGKDELLKYNGIVILGNEISSYDIKSANGLLFTTFSRTLSDAFANESILDMQGVTEAISRYYYKNGESFSGVSVSPSYQDRFEQFVSDALEYYDN